MPDFDALLVLSFGGPEGPDDVMPFLENVVRGRNVPRERLLDVAEHYQHFGGRSPINDQNRALVAAVQKRFEELHWNVPVYFGNRNWHPLLADELGKMKEDGIKRALVFATSAFGSYSGCRQYRENLAAAVEKVGPGTPELVSLRRFYNDPGFIEANVDRVKLALGELPSARLVFTAHSIPVSMAATAPYENQLRDAAELVASAVGRSGRWDLAWQSRSGPPQVPWLEPDILDHLTAMKSAGETGVIVSPLGFISDHMEVVWDLDHEAKEKAQELGLDFRRAGTAGTHPAFVETIVRLVKEQQDGEPAPVLGTLGTPRCQPDCCQPGRRPGRPPAAAS